MSFDADWATLRKAELETFAPSAVGDAVMAAWDQASVPPAVVRAWSRGPFALIAAATVVLVATSIAWLAVPRENPAAATEQPILRLSADPVFATESLRIVRVRMPRGALRALGMALVEPEAGGLVDVDVVVGDDGLPREIRRVTAVLEGMEERVR